MCVLLQAKAIKVGDRFPYLGHLFLRLEAAGHAVLDVESMLSVDPVVQRNSCSWFIVCEDCKVNTTCVEGADGGFKDIEIISILENPYDEREPTASEIEAGKDTDEPAECPRCNTAVEESSGPVGERILLCPNVDCEQGVVWEDTDDARRRIE